uniref:Fibronectin-binding domain-containing protein n=1 Tax=Ignisphaera aggregans TaxID=334771 RepID=A0A7J2T9N5_9CREN
MNQQRGSVENSSSIRQKKSMSWLDISVWLNEQKSLLIGAFVDNVYIYSKNLAVLRLRKSGEQPYRYLIIEPGKRISLTTFQLNLNILKGLTDTWRRHIRDCKVSQASQYNRERLVILTLTCGNEEKNLIIELLPRGTMVLTNSAMEIIIVLESKKMKDRVIVPKQKYEFPPKLWEVDVEGINSDRVLEELVKKKQNIVSYFVRALGFPPEIIETALYLCNLEGSSCRSIDKHVVECLIANIKSLLKEVIESPKPCIVYAHHVQIGFYPFIPQHLVKRHETEVELFQTLNEAINKYFIHDIEELVQKERLGPSIDDIEKLKHALQDMDKRLQERKEKYELLLRALRVFEEHYPELEEIHRCVQRVVRQEGWSNLSLCGTSIKAVDKFSGRYHVVIEDTDLELDVRMNLVDIYNSYRKRLSDASRDIKRIESEMARLREEISKMQLAINAERKSIEMALHRSREWYEKFHWAITSGGFLILGGRDAQQNIYLVKRFLEDKDIVLHADIHGGSTVIIKTSGKTVDEASLREAALLAACYSKAWKLGLHSIDVFWVQGSQVSLSPPPGEYLPRGGFMVYGKKNYLHNIALELAVGIEVLRSEIGCSIRVAVGSQDSIVKKCGAYFVIKPGDMKIDEIIERFLSELSKRGLESIAKAIDINDLRVKIPGKSRIVKIVVNEEIRKVLEEC